MPADRQDLASQRILVRHGVSCDLASLLLCNLKRAVALFTEHPEQALDLARGQRFSHN